MKDWYERSTSFWLSLLPCADGKWALAMTDEVQGNSYGAFSGSFPVNKPSKCSVRAIYNGTRSNRVFFRVVN